jgi:hypothetical protein
MSDVTKQQKQAAAVAAPSKGPSCSKYQYVILGLFLHATDQLLYGLILVYQRYFTNCYRFVVRIVKNEPRKTEYRILATGAEEEYVP